MRRWIAYVVAVVLAVALGPAGTASARADYPFRNPRLPLQARVDDLLKRLTLDEKVSLLHQYEPAIPRLGIKAFKTGTEALHGLAWSTDKAGNGAVVTAKATVFPQAVGLGSTWNPALLRQVGSAVGDEARGYHAVNPDVWGLQLWAPVANLLRDPRWGRNEEGYSEDPYLTGALSTAYGSGIEGGDPNHLRAAPVLKHYLGYNNEVNRDTTSSNLRPRVKHEYDEAAFRPAISTDAATGVMAAYNLVNGRPMTAHPDLNDVVRKWTGRDLVNVTDAGAPNNLVGSQKYYPSLPAADAAALRAGIDSFTSDDYHSDITINAVKSALQQGLLTESDVDTAVRHILSLRFRLGEFDPGGGPYGKIGKAAIDTPAHRALARQAADQAAVLLKNQGGTLPLKASGRVAVVGPLAKTTYTDWYSGAPPYRVTPVDGIRRRLAGHGTVTDSEGVDRIALKDVKTGKYVTASGGALAATAASAEGFDVFDWGQGILTLRNAANGKTVGRMSDAQGNWLDTFAADQDQPNGWFVQQQFKLERDGDAYVIRYAGYETAYGGPTYLTAGSDGTLHLGATTGADAAHFTEQTLVSGTDSAVSAARGADAAVVVVGSMPFINGREDHDRTTMALAEGQQALIKAVRKANPHTVVVVENSYPTVWDSSGVPAVLWTTHAGQETGNAVADVLFGDYDPAGRLTQTWYRSERDLPGILDYDIIKSGRTYQYYRGKPLYPFGYGLSYTTFRYGTPTVSSNGTITVDVPVTNTGRRPGDEVVQLYTHQRASRDPEPVQQLRAFQRVHLGPGQTTTVRLRVRAADLAHWDVTRSRPVVETGAYDLLIGASSADIRRRATVHVRGETIPARDLSRPTRAVDFDDYKGVELVDESKARGDAVAGKDGAWLEYADAQALGGTLTTTTASDGGGTIELRLDSPTGKLLGTAKIPDTGDIYKYATTTTRLTPARGHHNVYLVFGGNLRLSSFTVGRR